MKMKYNFLLVFALSIFLISFASAGLQVVNQSAQNLTKIVGQSQTFTIDILNNELFSIYNISIFDNPYVNFNVIPVLLSGQTARVTVNLTSDLAFNETFKIQGWYPAQVGASNVTYNISVDYYSGLSQCDLTIIKGDTVVWNNNVLDSIVMKNSVTSQEIVTILQGNYYQTKFETPYSLSYYFLRRGYVFTNTCTITALSDTGNVNDPSKDANFSLGVNIIYTPTTIVANFLENNYTINVFGSQDGVMSIRNTGTYTAKDIHLSNSWFAFSSNDFDILPGVTKAITYTISPRVISTNDTNKNYIQNLTISGNFATLNYPFTIFVPYYNLENANTTSNYGSLLDLLHQYCIEHPQESFCANQSKIVYVYGSDNSTVSMNFTQAQIKGIFDYMFQIGDNLDTFSAHTKENLDNLSSTMVAMGANVTSLDAYSKEQKATQVTTASTQSFIFIAVAILLLCALVGAIIFIYNRDKKRRQINRF